MFPICKFLVCAVPVARLPLCMLLLGITCTVTPVAAQYPDTLNVTTDTVALPTTGPVLADRIGNGVWWRPELDETSVTQVLENLKEWGIPNLYVDVFRSGETLFPSAVFPQRPGAESRDWLQYIITEAHSRNIRVHAWTQVLCWQEPDADSPSSHPILLDHPEYLDVTDKGTGFDGTSLARFVSPGVPEVRTLLLRLTQEISRYAIDGLNLDAVQYNHRAETGYNPGVVREFQDLYYLDPTDLEVDLDDDSEWMTWVSYREDKLTSLVQLMSDQARLAGTAAGRRLLLSVNVQPIYEENRGRNRAYQHWGQWLEEGLIDLTIPQCFHPDLPGLEKQLWQVRSVHMGSSIACIPGLMLDENTTNSHPTLREQRRLLKNTGFQHSTIMDYRGLLLDKQSATKPQDEEERGFWDFLRGNRHPAQQ